VPTLRRCTAAALAPAASAAAAWLVLAQALPATAQVKKDPSQIYSCVDERGRRLTSDRPIPECNAKEQKVLNTDGSLKSVRPPSLTADERADREAMEARAAEARLVQADAVRRDRNLRNRFPNEAAHRRSREGALDTVRVAMRASERRLADLSKERKPLLEESEFYKGKTLPGRLKQMLDANDAAVDAQRNAIQNQEAELVRINRLFDAELEHLRKLWAGAQPGSIGPMPTPTVDGPATAAATTPRGTP
jgi:hypothetical protein